MAEYSRFAQGQVTSNGKGVTVIVPYTPTKIRIYNQTKALNASAGVNAAWWYKDDGQGAAYLTTTSSGTPNTDTTTFVTSGGFSTIQAALLLQYGPLQLLGGSGGIAKTSSTELTVTTTSDHGLVPGNWVVFQNLYETSNTGMQQIAGIPFEVLSSASTTTFVIGWVGNSSNLTTIDGSATGNCGFKQILYPALYVPGVSVPWSITVSGGTGTVKTTAAHNFQVGQEIGFRIPSAWGAGELNELPNNTIPGSSNYYYVSSVTSDVEFEFVKAPSSITAFNVNQTFASFPGLKFPAVFATGDINSGGYPYTGGDLYPSPSIYNGTGLAAVNSINGPAIQGSYINATYQGFIIGSAICGSANDILDWEADYFDYVT